MKMKFIKYIIIEVNKIRLFKFIAFMGGLGGKPSGSTLDFLYSYCIACDENSPVLPRLTQSLKSRLIIKVDLFCL